MEAREAETEERLSGCVRAKDMRRAEPGCLNARISAVTPKTTRGFFWGRGGGSGQAY